MSEQQKFNSSGEVFAVAPPPTLYRFFKGEHGLSALVNGELKITPPREFNDPFEFAPGIDPNLKVSAEEMRAHFLAPNGFARATYCPKYAQNNEDSYAKWVEKAIRRPDIFPKHVQCLREGLTQAVSKAYGVICFSAFTEEALVAPQAIRHWSAYADDHRGLAIEFDGTTTFFTTPAGSGHFFKVSYESKRPYSKLSDFENLSDEALVQILRTWGEVKLECAWSAEAEWRMIAPLAAKSPNQPIPVVHRVRDERLLSLLQVWSAPPGCVIRRVILAPRASKELETSVRTILREPHYRHVILCQAREEPDSFSMRIEPI